jgi:hypothetical protein
MQMILIGKAAVIAVVAAAKVATRTAVPQTGVAPGRLRGWLQAAKRGARWGAVSPAGGSGTDQQLSVAMQLRGVRNKMPS